MNTIREIQALNKRELENAVSTEASWHADYRDTAYVYIGGLSFDLSEGDITTIFSQFGEPVYINLVRDKDTGKSKGFAFLKYEDQRSTDLAVDNLGGASVMGRLLKVDHTRYKRKEDEKVTDNTMDENALGQEKHIDKLGSEGKRKRRRSNSSGGEQVTRPALKEEDELAELMREHDEDDPMKDYLIAQKEEEIRMTSARRQKKKSHGHKDRETRGHHRHESRREEQDDKRRRAHKREQDRSLSMHGRD